MQSDHELHASGAPIRPPRVRVQRAAAERDAGFAGKRRSADSGDLVIVQRQIIVRRSEIDVVVAAQR